MSEGTQDAKGFHVNKIVYACAQGGELQPEKKQTPENLDGLAEGLTMKRLEALDTTPSAKAVVSNAKEGLEAIFDERDTQRGRKETIESVAEAYDIKPEEKAAPAKNLGRRKKLAA